MEDSLWGLISLHDEQKIVYVRHTCPTRRKIACRKHNFPSRPPWTRNNTEQRKENRKLLEEAKTEIVASGELPENYKLYVTRRNTRPEIIKKKRYKETKRSHRGEEVDENHTGVDQLPHVMGS